MAKKDMGASGQMLKENISASAQTVAAVGSVVEVSPSPGEGTSGFSRSEASVALKTTIYHARTLAGRSVEE